MMALKAKILNGKSRSKSLSVELSLGGCSIGWLAGWGVEDLIVGWLGWWLASWPGWCLW